jgi:membrane-associated protease RseP (regulator of RpoE activity)
MSINDLNDAKASRGSRLAAAICIAVASAGMITPCLAMAADTIRNEEAKKDEKSEVEREQKLDAARKRLDEAAREVAELSMQISQDAMPRFARVFNTRAMASRTMLGVNIGTERSNERKEGVELLGVSPGGAAAEAGLKAGDVIVELKGKSLKQSGNETPREKLLTAMRDVEPEEKVAVRYVRDGKTASATVVARPVDRLFTMPAAVSRHRIEGLPNFRFMRADGAFGSAELVPLTPKLGQYFGTDKGLLVVRAPDSRLPLEEGDVILSIDGRVPVNASHAFRILGSYQPGETVQLTTLRMKKRIETKVKVPEDVWDGGIESAPLPPPPPGDVLMRAPGPMPGVPALPPPRDDTA